MLFEERSPAFTHARTPTRTPTRTPAAAAAPSPSPSPVATSAPTRTPGTQTPPKGQELSRVNSLKRAFEKSPQSPELRQRALPPALTSPKQRTTHTSARKGMGQIKELRVGFDFLCLFASICMLQIPPLSRHRRPLRQRLWSRVRCTYASRMQHNMRLMHMYTLGAQLSDTSRRLSALSNSLHFVKSSEEEPECECLVFDIKLSETFDCSARVRKRNQCRSAS
jgi:hypothetical protein